MALSTDEIRTNYAASFPGELDPGWCAEFDEWLAAHDRETAEATLRDAANRLVHHQPAVEQLHGMADRIREGKPDA